MKLAVMQPYFFPYIGYFQLIRAVDKFIVYDNVGFMKKSWISRNQILAKNTGPCWITVPVVKKSSLSKIGEIKIDDSQNWRHKLKKKLEFNYKKASMFDAVMPLCLEIIDYNANMLSDFNGNLVRRICDYLGILTQIETDTEKYRQIETQLVNFGHDNLYRKFNEESIDNKNLRVMELCRQEGADVYINPFGGQNMYSRPLFKKNGINLFFVSSVLKPYEQFSPEFYPSLSIIDVMMFNKPEQMQALLDSYNLI